MKSDVGSGSRPKSQTAGEPARPRLRAKLELIAVTVLLLVYVWLWQSRSVVLEAVVVVAVLVILWRSHRSRGEGAGDLGFRLDNLGPSLALVAVIVMPLLALVAAVGFAFGLTRELPVPGLGERLLSMPAFGVLQQYLLLGFYRRRFAEVLQPGALASVAAAAVFALLHAPTLWLVATTFFAGLGAIWLYRRSPNLWVIGVAHGLLSVAIAMFLAELLPRGLKVGWRAL